MLLFNVTHVTVLASEWMGVTYRAAGLADHVIRFDNRAQNHNYNILINKQDCSKPSEARLAQCTVPDIISQTPRLTLDFSG